MHHPPCGDCRAGFFVNCGKFFDGVLIDNRLVYTRHAEACESLRFEYIYHLLHETLQRLTKPL